MVTKKTTTKSESKNSKDSTVSTVKNMWANFYASPLVVLVLLISVLVFTFYSGVLYTKVLYLQGDLTAAKPSADAPAPPSIPAAGGSIDNLPEISDEDHYRGSADAKIVLVEYSDFECPFCETFHNTAVQALSEYDGQFAWVFRHFPLDSLHPQAQALAQASECAFDQGGDDAFWTYGDALFEEKPRTAEDYSALAGRLGLNTGEFDTCLSSGKFADKVAEQQQGGLSAGITGTPGNILLNLETGESTTLPGAVPLDTLKQAIESLL